MKNDKKTISRPKGTNDLLPGESYKWRYVENILREAADDFGYDEIRFPTFEYTELFVRGVGETTDVVQKEMFTFTDRGGRSITLRPEGTASVVRSFLENSLYAAGLPVKCRYIAPNFRGEAPQAGRYREFYQFGAEYLGTDSPAADAEIISLMVTILNRLGIKNISLEINSIGCPECRVHFHAALKDYFKAYEKDLCDTCKDRLNKNPMRILDCKNPDCQKISENVPVGLDFLCGPCNEHFEALKSALTEMDIAFAVNPKIVRGLDYYTRTVFEFVSSDLGAQSTVCGGGRYDGLVEALGGSPTPAIGFAMGLERLLMVMEAQGIEIPKSERLKVFIATLGDKAEMPVQRLVYGLRKMGISAERDTTGRGLKAQMKYANRLNAKYSMVVGDGELESRKVKVKNMDTGEEAECLLDIEEIAKELALRL